MKKILFLLLFIFILACDEKVDFPQDTDSENRNSPTQTKDIEFTKVQDSILSNYSRAIKLINQIDSELGKLAQVPALSETSNYETDILKKIDYLSFQLKSSNDDIKKLEIKIKSMGRENKSLQEKIQTLEIILAEKDKIIQNQQSRINDLENELNRTRTERDLVLTEKETIEKFAQETENQKNTAYYIISKEKNLKNDNIIKMEGEGFLGIGGKYIPSPEAELKFFSKIDITKDTLLPLPGNVKVSEIVSSHSKRLMEVITSSSGGDLLKIKNPDIFWRTDKMLIIIVEDK